MLSLRKKESSTEKLFVLHLQSLSHVLLPPPNSLFPSSKLSFSLFSHPWYTFAPFLSDPWSGRLRSSFESRVSKVALFIHIGHEKEEDPKLGEVHTLQEERIHSFPFEETFSSFPQFLHSLNPLKKSHCQKSVVMSKGLWWRGFEGQEKRRRGEKEKRPPKKKERRTPKERTHHVTQRRVKSKGWRAQSEGIENKYTLLFKMRNSERERESEGWKRERERDGAKRATPHPGS